MLMWIIDCVKQSNKYYSLLHSYVPDYIAVNGRIYWYEHAMRDMAISKWIINQRVKIEDNQP